MQQYTTIQIRAILVAIVAPSPSLRVSSEISCGMGAATTIRFGTTTHSQRLRQTDPSGIYFCLRRRQLRQALGFGFGGLGGGKLKRELLGQNKLDSRDLLGNIYRKRQPISEFLPFALLPSALRVPGSAPKKVDA